MSDVTADNALGTIEVVADETEGERHTRLSTATARLRGSAPLSPDRWFQIAGWILIPLGLACILFGWYGTAHTTRVWEQTPFVVSGGLMGLGLLFVGGFAYYSYWLTRLVQDARTQANDAAELARRQADALDRIEALLREQQMVASPSSTEMLVATATGTMAHRPSCPMVAGKANLRRVDAADPSLGRCLVCEPDLAPAANGESARPAVRSGRRR